MKALRTHEASSGAALTYEDAPDPKPAMGDVLVQVHACGITPGELEWPSTKTDRLGRSRLPAIPGHEVSGVVTAVGYGISGVTVGQEVYGLTDFYRDGGAAALVAVEARNLAPAPATISPVEAAALPLAGLTAWQALFDHGELKSGQTVLIQGAGGAVGTLAVQLAHAVGARVIATGRGGVRARVIRLGADTFVDLTQQRFEEIAGQVDLVFDTIGGEILARSAAVVKPGGTLVSIVTAPAVQSRHVRGLFFVVEPDRAQLVELAARVDAGKIRVQIGAVHPLSEGQAAFQAQANHEVQGKVVLQP